MAFRHVFRGCCWNLPPPKTAIIRHNTQIFSRLGSGTVIAFPPDVTIAIPISHERISPLFDTAARLLLITRRRGKEVGRKEIILNPQPLEGLARSVAEMRVDVLLCAAISESLLRDLERRRVQVRPHLCGEVESVLRAFDCGQLRRDEFRMPGCGHRHSPGGCCRRRGNRRAANPVGK